MLESDVCDYSDPYIVVEGTVTATDPNDANYKKELAFKNNAPFISCISKINNTLTDNAEDVMPRYNLIEYSKNYTKTPGSLWNCSRNEPNSNVGGENSNVNYSTKDLKSFDYKTKITVRLEGINRTKENIQILVPLKHLSIFWRALDIPLINCKINLNLV